MQRLQVEAQHCPGRYANLYRAGENGPGPRQKLKIGGKKIENPYQKSDRQENWPLLRA